MYRMLSIDEKFRIIEPFLGRERTEMMRQGYYVEDEDFQKRLYESKIDTIISRLAKRSIDKEILLPPPQKSFCAGDIQIGNVEYIGQKLFPYNMNLKNINRHVGIFGSTGSGKTTLAANIIRELYRRKIPTIVIDWETSYRALAKDMPDFIVYTVGTDINPFYLNPFDVPPGITIQEYAKNLVTIISHDYLGGQGSDTVLLEYILESYAQKHAPSFADLISIIDREIVQKLKTRGKLGGRTGLWKETVLRQNKFMSIGCIGNVINTNRHIPIENLLDKWIVLELGNLKSPHDRAFVSHFLLNQLVLHFQHKGIVTEELKLVIVMEEFLLTRHAGLEA